MRPLVGQALLAQEAYAPPLFTPGDILHFLFAAVLVVSLLGLLVLLTRAVALLAEIRNLLARNRHDTAASQTRTDQRPPG